MTRIKLNRATIADVAARAGVSIATVSRVINGTGVVNPATAERVHAAIDALGYQPHAAARSLASHKTSTIGLILTDISGNFFSPLLRGIESTTREAGYDLLIFTSQVGARPGDPRPLPVGSHNADGMLVFLDAVSDAELVRLYAMGFPMVLLHRTPPQDAPIPSVTVENKNGARGITAHLIEAHGRRRIAFLAGPPGNEDASWRETGYREALAQHGIPIDPRLIVRGDFDQLVARRAVASLLGQGVEFDAIFAADDESALGALTLLKEKGVSVPEQVALVGFDDMDVSQYLTPPLTTVRAPTEQVGVEAARQLLHLIQAGEAAPLTLLPTQIVVRSSCGCPPPA